MTKAIETLVGADALAFREAIKPHINAILTEDGFTRAALDQAVVNATANGAAGAQAVVDTVPALVQPIADDAQGYAGFNLRSDAITFAPKMSTGEVTSVFGELSTATYAAVAGEIALGGTVATAGSLIPRNGKYTKQASGVLWRTGDSQEQKAGAKADTAAGSAVEAANTLAAQVAANSLLQVQITGLGNLINAQAAMITALTRRIGNFETDINGRLDSLKDDYADFWISSVSSARSDSNAGTSRLLPWATLAALKAYVAANAGMLTGKTIAYENGGNYEPWDLWELPANSCVVTNYGLDAAKPKFDCTAAITGWTETAPGSGKWTVTLARLANSKNYGNYFIDDVTNPTGLMAMRKVESEAALAGKGDYVCYAANETSASITLIMNCATNPNSNGRSFRWSKYARAVTLTGRRNRIEGLWAIGNAHQDGGPVLYGDSGAKENLGGNTLTRCLVDWGARHSAYIGSGSIPSYCSFNEFRGAANEIETGGVLNTAGMANAVVFNSPDHSTAKCVSFGNTYNGLARPDYISVRPYNFTGPYGHDGDAQRPMLRFESVNDNFISMANCANPCGQTNLLKGQSFVNVMQACLPNMGGISIEMTEVVSGSMCDILMYNFNLIGTVNFTYHHNGVMVIRDAGMGSAGWVRCGEGSSGVTNLDFYNNSFHIQGIRTANANRYFIRNRAGTFRFVNNQVGPLAPPVDFLFDLGVGSGVVTLGAISGNTYPKGINFRLAGTAYRGLAAWAAVAGEAGSVYAALPTAKFNDDFNGADANLETASGWARLNGAAIDLQRRGNMLYSGTSSLTATLYTRGSMDTKDQYARFILRNTASGGGAAMRVVDASNNFFVRASTTQLQLARVLAGAVSTPGTSSNITPVDGMEVICVLREYTDPFTGALTTRLSFVGDGALGANLVDVTAAALSNELKVGAVARGAIGNVLDDLQFGPAPLAYAA